MAGRPSSYTHELGLEILSGMASGLTLTEICEADDKPSRQTVYRWTEGNAEFRDALARARDAQAHAIAEGGYLRARDAKDAALDRLAFDGAKWFAAKMAPKHYGERLQVDATVKRSAQEMTDDELAAIAAGSRVDAPPSTEG